MDLRISTRRGLCLIFLLWYPERLYAQTATAATGTLQDIVISGGSLRPADASSSSPLTVIDAEAIAASSATSLDQLLNKLPSFGSQGVNGNQNDGGYGAAFVDLRNLNFNRTLVLVNGRRFVLSGIKTDEAVDMNNIPLSLIDHIEVMRDGSEPKYGADAIAGAVNIVLKKDFDGVAASAMGGFSGHGDGATENFSASFGHNFTSGANITFSAGQSHSNPILQSDRSWARNPITAATAGSDGSLQLTRGESATPGGHALTASGVDAQMLGGGQFRDFNAGTDSYDFSQERYLQAGQDRKTATLLAHGDLAEDISAFTELSYVLRHSTSLNPPVTLGLSGTSKYPSGFVVPAGNAFNPFGEDVTLQRVLTEVGDQITQTEATTTRAVFGLEGAVAGGTWSVSANHGETHQTYRVSNAVNLTKVFNTLSDDPSVCAAASGCVPANYFGPGSLSSAAVNYIRYTDSARSSYRENQILGSFERPLAVLPGGAWTAKLWGEYRTEYGSTLPDPVTAAGDQAGADSAATGGGYRSREIFLDTSLPLLKDLPLVKSLTIEGSARYSSYDRFGEFPTWKTALSWAPVGDIRFRATVGAGRRVPAITEAFGGSTASFLAVQDPCDSVSGSLGNPAVAANCRKLGLSSQFTQASPLLSVANGGNPNLTPESSRNFTLGTVLTPRWLPALTVSADYYNIRVRNAINALSDADPNFIPNQCYSSVNMSSPYCALITRAASGQITNILAPDMNIGAIHTDGIDLGLTYGVSIGKAGRLSFDWQNSFLLDYRVQEAPNTPFVQYAGTFPGLIATGSYSRYKSVLTTSFDTDSWTYDWAIRYIDGAKVQGQDTALYDKAPGIFYHDLGVTWRLEPVTLRFGIDNLFDQKPPTLMDGLSNTNLNSYDVVGRFFYVRTSVTF